ncbi:site-2 protease family protein [Neorhodopirellula pilleata]|uniref:Regulator of sigma-E protease RseP n=1 Tax=Neorhodopirellula pilleata TaxID=2714738 RepID=A0A5C6AUG6_9BACT|nr:site-2 protease family protein [Neorhodopirellula pilleata]TWU01814.1 Regulator of sigma-E protease RseP [Neorhodopirellula pilleata]
MSPFIDNPLVLILLAASEDPSWIVTLLTSTWLWTKVALGIGLVVFVHELGHFVAAKSFGVKCEKFYVGFDVPIQIGPIKFPRTLGKFTYGETEYGIGIIPLGGYVKMLGQDDDPRKAEQEAERIRLAGGDEDAEPELDPRSYPAKKVWQRMIIISAGVVMNVITGILFATIAYFYGVPYTPAIVGGVSPGGPAWQAGIEPGGRVISVADLPDDEQLHFNEMKLAIMTEGMDTPDQAIDVRLSYDDEIRDYELTPQSHPIEPSLKLIGIHGPTGTSLPSKLFAMPNSAAANVLTDDDAGAEVIAMDGKPLDANALMPITPVLDRIVSSPSEPIELTLVSVDGTNRSITLAPQNEKDFGVRFGVGPIKALVKGGPAEAAGLKIGDQIVSVDGDADLDAYSLLLRSFMTGQDIEVQIRRGEGDDAIEKTVSLQPASIVQTKSPVSELGDTMGIQSLGLAYAPTTVVTRVTAEASDLKVGDLVREVRIRFTDPQARQSLVDIIGEETIQTLSKGWEVGDAMPLGVLMETIQILPVGTEVLIKATRPPEGEVIETKMMVQATDRFWYDRGINFMAVDAIQTADSFGEALSLGLREGVRRLGNVGRFLGMLVTGKVEAKFLGGPIRIAQMASYEAERGVSAQLLFLTMLSMNLAILNFLPIPALDGGHMLFLTAEAIRGKRLNEALEMRLTFAGVLALLALMIFVFANDILHLN